jgi:hypothetical protein
MSITLTWLPNTEPDIASYDVQRAPDAGGIPGTFVDCVNIVHDLLGPHYNPASNRFFYVDTSGSLSHWYRMRAVDINGNASGYSNPFQPSESTTPPPFPNTIPLDDTYEYQTGSNLKYIDEHGHPIAEVQVRVYKRIDFDLNNFAAAVGVTTTNAEGAWNNPIIVEAGYTYVVHYFKPGAYGPDHQEVVVP